MKDGGDDSLWFPSGSAARGVDAALSPAQDEPGLGPAGRPGLGPAGRPGLCRLRCSGLDGLEASGWSARPPPRPCVCPRQWGRQGCAAARALPSCGNERVQAGVLFRWHQNAACSHPLILHDLALLRVLFQV